MRNAGRRGAARHLPGAGVTEQTRVRIAGQVGSAADLRQGEDARVAYRVSGTEPTATEVQVMRSEPEPGSTGSPGREEQPAQGQQPQR
ncbi:MAG TPA: hypothetical protein VIV57_14845 [Anaeromyxobacter sp.]